MADTPTISQNLAPSSAPSSAPTVIPASKVGAVSSAINQATPPNRHGQEQNLTQREDFQQPKPRENKPVDKEISLDDFTDNGEHEENPFTPESEDSKIAKAKIAKAKVDPTVAKTEKKVNKELSDDDKNDPASKVKDESDNKLELEINLDENADPTKLLEVKSKSRDYSKFKPEHQEFLKHLPNAAFLKASSELTKLYEIEAENGKLKNELKESATGKLPASYYEHPEGFRLSSQFSELSNEMQYYDFEVSHWKSQLANIKRGQPWLELLGYDEKTRQPRFRKIEPLTITNADGEKVVTLDVDNEQKVSDYIQSVTEGRKETIGKLEQIKQQHINDYQRSKEGLDSLEKQFFSNFADETKLPKAVKADIQLAKDAIDKSTPAFSKNPMSKLLIYSYATIKFQQRQIQQLAQFLNKEKEKMENSRMAGPSRGEFITGGSGESDRIISEKDFDD